MLCLINYVYFGAAHSLVIVNIPIVLKPVQTNYRWENSVSDVLITHITSTLRHKIFTFSLRTGINPTSIACLYFYHLYSEIPSCDIKIAHAVWISQWQVDLLVQYTLTVKSQNCICVNENLRSKQIPGSVPQKSLEILWDTAVTQEGEFNTAVFRLLLVFTYLLFLFSRFSYKFIKFT